jgi:threonine/homoserine/homoserine lactone efflux protein
LITMKAVVGLTLVDLVLVLTPGPNMIYLVSRSLSQGRRAGLVSLLGTLTGFVIYMTLANLGLSGVFATTPVAYDAVRIAGTLYLFYLAWQALRPGGMAVFETTAETTAQTTAEAITEATAETPRDSGVKLYRMGLVTNLLNPKAAILYLALIPQFIDLARGDVTGQGFLLGGIQICESGTVNASIVLAAAGIAAFLNARPSWLRWQRRATGILLAVVGLTIALGA